MQEVYFKKEVYEQTQTLDLTRLTEAQLQTLGEAYDRIAHSSLLPFPEMADDPTRKQIDDAIANALGLPSLDSLRRTLAREPVVCGVPLYTSPGAIPVSLQASLELL